MMSFSDVPTRDSVTLSVLTYRDMEGRIMYGQHPEALEQQTERHCFEEGQPKEITLTELEPDTRYFSTASLGKTPIGNRCRQARFGLSIHNVLKAPPLPSQCKPILT